MTNAFDWDTLSPEERLVAEQAILNLRSLNKACDAAPDGKVLAIAERLAMDQGREQIRRTLEISLTAQATEVEKKGCAAEAVHAADSAHTVDEKHGKC